MLLATNNGVWGYQSPVYMEWKPFRKYTFHNNLFLTLHLKTEWQMIFLLDALSVMIMNWIPNPLFEVNQSKCCLDNQVSKLVM